MNDLFTYTLRLADSSLVIGHRLSEWCGHGPILEEDIAMTNIALDHIGTATAFYEYAAQLEGKGRTADDLAYFRDERMYTNNLLVEQPNGDFAVTMLRQFLFSAYTYLLYTELKNSSDVTISGIAEKALKEATYHLRHSSQWIIRMGDGTEESHNKVTDAIADLWKYTGDMFVMDKVDANLIKAGTIADTSGVKTKWGGIVAQVFQEATLQVPESTYAMTGGYKGQHTEHLGFLLAEMQHLQRTYPGAQW